MPLILMLAAMLLVPWGRAAALDTGTVLLNYVEGEYELASGSLVEETIPGRNKLNIPNSASAWVIITNEPQLCFAVKKIAQDRTTWLETPQISSGRRLCFTISFSNCGTATPQTVEVIDRTPANVNMMAPWNVIYSPINANKAQWRPVGAATWQDSDPANLAGPIELRWLWNDPANPIVIGLSGYINYCVTVQ